jgi:hypothetical protein
MSSQLCQAQSDIFDEEFDRVDAGTMTAARGFRAAGRRTRICSKVMGSKWASLSASLSLLASCLVRLCFGCSRNIS